MKMFRFLAFATILLCSLQTEAQAVFHDYSGTGVERRLGHGRDSLKNSEFYNAYAKAYKASDWKACYRPWRELMTRAPFCTYNITNCNASVYFLLQSLMKEEQDPILRYVYFKDAMEVLDFAVANYKSLNTFTDVKHPTFTPGVLKCRKAHYYRELGQYIPEKAYKKDVAYQNFVDAFATLQAETVSDDDDAELEIPAAYLEEFFKVCQDLYDTDHEKYFEQFLTDYVMCQEACDDMMAKYHSRDSLKYAYYAAARNNVTAYFEQSGAGNKENLIEYYTPRLKEHRQDLGYLNRAINLMVNNGCSGEELFFQACEMAYMLKPDYLNCIGMGFSTLTIDRDEAKQYFDQACTLAETPKQKWIATKGTADALATTPQPQKTEEESNTEYNARVDAWRGVMRAAAIYYNDALEYAKAAAIEGQYVAPVYYSLANCYYKAQEFNSALQALALTKASYSQYDESKNEALLGAIERGAENKRKRDEAYAAQLKNQKLREKWEREQAERLRKQKEEDAFWGKK